MEGNIPLVSTRFRALQHRNFQLFIAGQLVSLIGTWMQSTAQLWLVYKLTGSAAQQMLKLVEGLEEHDDVQHVYANFDIDEKEMAVMAAQP